MKPQRSHVLSGVIVAAAVALVVALLARDSDHALDARDGPAATLGEEARKELPGSTAERPSLATDGPDPASERSTSATSEGSVPASRKSLPLAEDPTSVADATSPDSGGPGGESDSYPSPDDAPGDWAPILNDEALPCTESRAPVNFETLSVGPSIDGLPLTYTERRCGGGPTAARVNYLSYIYGNCTVPKGESGCQPPLEIQTWPSCQRFLAKYSFRGKPLSHRVLSTGDGAEVVEFNFALDKRIEVYTNASTVVIFAVDQNLALEAVEMLRPEEEEEPAAISPEDLSKQRPDRLEPPEHGSLEGALSCQA